MSGVESITSGRDPISHVIDTMDAHGDDATKKLSPDSIEGQQISTQSDDAEIIEVYPDGGRAWLVCLSVLLLHFAAWGCNLALSIYLSHYIAVSDDFKNIPRSTISLISGASTCLMLILSPFSNYIEDLIGIRNCVALGAVINSVALYLTSLTTNITGLILTQSVMAGIGRGMIVTPTSYILSQWFKKRCTLATGLSHTGTGAGGMVFSFVTNYFISNYGLNSSYHASNVISTGIAIPCIFLLSSRCPRINARTGEPAPLIKKTSVLSWKALKSWIALIFFIRVFLSQWSYMCIRSIIPTYNSEALGKPESEGAMLQLIYSFGMATGRPIGGLIADKFGVTLMAIILESIALLSYYVLWLPASGIIAMGAHSLIEGLTAGVIFLTALPIAMRIVRQEYVRSIMTVVWITSALASLLSIFVSLLIVDYAKADGLSTITSYQITIGFNSVFVIIAIGLSVILHLKLKKNKKQEAPRNPNNPTLSETIENH